jgi:hypothetical protein
MWVCVYSCIFSAFHYSICGMSGSTIFSGFITYTVRFADKSLLNIKYVFWFSLRILSETLLILRRIDQVIMNVLRSSSKVLSDLNETWTFVHRFSKNSHIDVFWKFFHSEPSCSIRSDLTKLIFAFRNFANAPKNKTIYRFAKLMYVPNFRYQITYTFVITHTLTPTDGQRLHVKCGWRRRFYELKTYFAVIWRPR